MAWAEESVLIRSCLGKVASYVGGRADADGGLLFLVSDGFQIGPSDAIESLLRDRSGTVGQASGGLPAGMPSLTITGELKRVIHEVTARGWVFLPWSPSGGGGRGDLGSAASVVRRSVDDPVLGARGAEEVQALSNPLEPLRSMADASGSEVLLHADGLERTDALLSGLHLLTYSVDRVRDGGVHRIDVSSLVPGVTVRSPRALSAGTPEWSAVARARRRAEGGAPEGALRVEASVESPRKKLSGRIETRVDLAPLLPTLRVLGEGRLRVTVAFLEEGREPFVRQEARPLPREEFARTWIWEAPIEALPAKGRLVVDVEELTTGEHGSSSIALPLPKEP